MIKSQLLLALRSLKSKKLRTSLTILGVALGVAVIFATQITINSTLTSFDSMVKAVAGGADLLVSLPVDLNQLASGETSKTTTLITSQTGVKIKKLRGVKLVSSTLVSRAFLAADSTPVTVFGLNPAQDSRLRDYHFLKGSFFQGKKEAVIPQELSQKKRLKVGDQLKLKTLAQKNFTFKISGILTDSGAGRLTGGQAVFLSLPATRQLFPVKGYSNLDIDLKKGTDINQLKTKIKQIDSSLLVEEPASRAEAEKKFLDLLNVGLIFFGTIALFVGAFLVLNTFNMIVKEQTRELGLLRALGASRKQTGGYILTQAVIVGLVGSIIGLTGGYFLSTSLIRYFTQTTGTTVLGKSFKVTNLLTAFFIGFIFTLVAVLRPAAKASRLSPLTAITGVEVSFSWRRPLARQQKLAFFSRHFIPLLLLLVGFFLSSRFSARLLPKVLPFLVGQDLKQRQLAIFIILLGFVGLLPAIVKVLFSFLASLAKRLKQPLLQLTTGNLLANPARTAATAAATMVTVAMLIIIGGLISSFQKAVNEWLDVSVKADIFVTTEDLNDTLPANLAQKLSKLKAVKDLTTIRFFPVRTSKGEFLTFRAVNPQDFKKFANFQFVKGKERAAYKRLRQGQAVFISSVTANRHHLKVGQRLKLQTPSGVKSFFIAAEVVDFAGELGDLVVGSQADAKKFFRVSSRISSLRLKLKTGQPIKPTVRKVKKLLSSYSGGRVEDVANFKKRVNQEVERTFAVFNVLALLAFLVAVLSIFNTLIMNIFERQKEIGVLRAVGLSRWQLSKMLTLEAVLMGLTGGFIGQGVGLMLANNLVVNMNRISGHSLNFIVPIKTLYLSAFLSLAFAVIAAAYPAYKAGRLDLTKALQYE